MKKLLCAVLSGIMAFSAFTVAVPITASAAESQESVSATYGNFEYTLEDDFTCTITGYNGTASNVTIPSTIYGNKVTKIGYSSFEENNNLMSVTLPNSIKYIDHYAFRSCENLKSITIPNSVKTIGSGVFSGCISLKNITVPSSVTELGSGVFDGCKNLINANFSYGIKEFSEYLFYNCISLTSINIPNSVKKVETDCFRGCTNLKSVSIGYGVEEIAFDWHPSFLYCNSLESITVNSNNKNFCSSDGVLFNKDKSEIKLYPKSKRNTNYIVPNSVKVLYCDDAMYGGNFTDCKYLKTITIPSNVTRIDDYAVGYNTNDWDFIKVSGFTIKGYKGTVAERYARNNDFNFVQLQVVPTSVALNKTTLTLDIGKTSNLRATVYPSNASNKKCTWSSSNTSVATVDGNGKVTAKASGTATITVKTSNGKTATCKVTVNLPAPQITGLSNTTGGIKISWNKVDGAYGYRLYYKPASGGWKRFKDTTATSFTDSGVVPNKTETYTIRCIDKNGNTISGFNSTGWSKKYTPAAPTVSKLDITTGGIKLSWNKIAGVYGYRLYYKTSSGGWKRFKDTTATSFTDSGVSPNRTETYTIRCIDKNGNTVSGFNSKGWSKKYTPVAPTISKLENTSGGIKISWNKIAGVYGYRLYYKTSSGGWKRFKDTTATSFTDSGVSPNRTETYTIRCIDKNGNTVSGFYSKGWSITRK
nr:leucine-rich repeat protein [Ruminococcus sp.]